MPEREPSFLLVDDWLGRMFITIKRYQPVQHGPRSRWESISIVGWVEGECFGRLAKLGTMARVQLEREPECKAVIMFVEYVKDVSPFVIEVRFELRREIQ